MARWTLAAAAAVVLATVLAAAGSVSAAALYAGSTEKYSVAFKAEGAKRYVMQFAGRTHCYYTEPEESAGGGGFSVFPAPKLMHEGRRGGYAAGETGGDSYSLSVAEIRGAEFSTDAVTGKYAYDDYGKRGPIEIFLRKTGGEVGGIRGTFVPRCPIGKGRSVPARHALFRRPASENLEKGNRFMRRVSHQGRARSGGRYRETITISGRVRNDAVVGTYLRVRTSAPGGERCVTGPLPVRAVRYLPQVG